MESKIKNEVKGKDKETYDAIRAKHYGDRDYIEFEEAHTMSNEINEGNN